VYANTALQAQGGDFKPDLSRALFHQRVDDAQKNLTRAASSRDGQFNIATDPEVNLQVNYALNAQINRLQKQVEFDSLLAHNAKLTYLRGMAELLLRFNEKRTKGNMGWPQLPMLISAFDKLLQSELNKAPLAEALMQYPFAVADILAGNFAFSQSLSIGQAKEAIFLKYLQENPKKLLKKLNEHPYYNYSYADSLIRVAARRYPEELVTYAQASNTPFGQKIAGCQDPLVKMLVDLSNDNRGQMFFPFLDKLSRGEITREIVEKAVKDSAAYYSLLVTTQVEYAGRLAKSDTPVVMKGLQDMLRKKSQETYVTTINGLHDFPAPVRFKKIQGLSAQELYYLIVLNEIEIYTSSYTYVYKRIFEVMPYPSADSLLALVNHDKYKKFLTMASNYNTLNDFLGRMSEQSSTALMTAFVNNLDRGTGEDDIEDAVDVANAYASITLPSIRSLMYSQVSKNLDDAIAAGNERGTTIYRLEKLIMASNDSIGNVNLSAELGIPPVYEIKNESLRDAQGRIVLQMFFYGDEGGKGSFNTLMRLYGDKRYWTINATPDWVEFTSVGTAVPFVLYANRALDEEKDLDEEAQRKLIKYMSDNGIHPSITVHRGHSYFLKYTIEKMLPSSKVVVLGSCGAYHNLTDVLRISPDAYIISSKQVGYGEINVALFGYLIDQLKTGKDVIWPVMMSEVAGRISAAKKEGYDDYIFPHKNLGALFIKAYRRAIAGEG
jgi:hypothetical protein